MAARTTAPVRGDTAVRAIDERLIIPLPQEASDALPSRGQVAVDAVLNDHELTTVVEPDGRRGHWLRVDDALRTALDLADGTPVRFTLTPGDVGVDHPHGALGMGALGGCDPEPGHPRPPRRGLDRQAARREAPPLLLRPLLLHRPGAGTQRQVEGLIDVLRACER